MNLKGAVEALKVLRGKVKDFFVIDKSLSIDGACADAKVTGDELAKKVSVSDIVDNLTSRDASRPLSARQGTLINEKTVQYLGDIAPRNMNEFNSLRGNGYFFYRSHNLEQHDQDETVFEENGIFFIHEDVYDGPRIQEYLSNSGLYCRRYGSEDDLDWEAWEWENPPMELGYEYKTTERFRGKPVYVSEVSIGTMPNNDSSTVNLSILNVDRLFSAELYTEHESQGRTFAYASNDIRCYAGTTTAGGVYIITHSSRDLSAEKGFVILKYTKTTD